MNVLTEPNWMTVDLLRDLTEQAKLSPRRRKNYNFHTDNNAICHRLLNAMEPDSYISPHRHIDPNKDETIVILSGRIGVVFFDEEGVITSDGVLDSTAQQFGVTIPVGIFHSLVALTPGVIFLESKAGPYLPLADEEKAMWAPQENDATASDYLESLRKRFTR